ncbi:hypothetical protein [Natronosalvus caseinilyticus]|uniref:hypothetical protein n=1 Tax=Natronosalvus caseinilyticus TaxID=2953747 RepID=UPI0028A9A734|nr:hypothetical protein [Natronosalvus caseinilyticus]
MSSASATTQATCADCGRLVDSGVLEIVSTGFGPGNKYTLDFCSITCRARWRGDDVVLATTRQTTLSANGWMG